MDNTWSLKFLDSKTDGLKIPEVFSIVLVLTDYFINFDLTFPFETEYVERKTDVVSNIAVISKLKPKLLETSSGKDFLGKCSCQFFKNEGLKSCSRKTSEGAAFAEKVYAITKKFMQLLVIC